MTNTDRPAAPRGKRRLRRVLGIGVLVVLVLLIAAVILAPTIGSAMAPGIIEGSVNPGIKGRVKVAKASIGWFSGLEAGPVEVYDPEGKLAASVRTSAPVTLWQAVSGRYWSARSLDLGTVEVSGQLDLRQYNDGTTNLDRALAPKSPSAATGGKAGKPSKEGAASGEPNMPAVRATLKVTQLDISVRNEKDNFVSEIGLKPLKGEAKIDADPSAPGGGVIKAQADFSGNALATGAGAQAAPMTLKLDADVKQTAAGRWTPDGIDHARIKLALTNAPIPIADALASLGGALVQAVGNTADVNIDVDGNASKMGGAVRLTSAGLNADANLAVQDGVLSAAPDKPSTVALKSTDFLASLPQAREGVASAGQHVKLEQAPSVQITLEHLRIPLPKGAGAGGGGAGGGASGGTSDLAKLDFRGANVGLRVKISGMSGQVLLPARAGGASAGSAPGESTWKPFSVEPLELAVNIDDFAKPIAISTGTKATLGGEPAGDVSLAINAEGLLDNAGHLRALVGGQAGLADKAEAKLRIAGMSTALLQPVVAGTGLPLQLAQDVGPTLDVTFNAKAAVAGVTGAGALGGGLESLPPLDVSGQVTSANIHANIAARLDKAVLTTSGDGIRLTIDSAAPLAQRIVASSREDQLKDASRDPNAAPPPEITLTGAGKVEITAKDVAISLKDTSPAAILGQGRGDFGLALTDLNAAVDMGGSKSPVRIDRCALAAALGTADYPEVTVDGKLAYENQPFTISGGYKFAKFDKGLPGGNATAQLVALKPVGAIEIKGVPRALLGIVPSLSAYAGAAATAAAGADAAGADALAAAVRDALGPTADVTLRMIQAPQDKGGGHYVAAIVNTAADGAHADVWLRVTESLAEISTVNTYLQPQPRWVNPLLASMSAPAEPGAPGSAPMRLGAPMKLSLIVDKPAKIPLVTTPDGSISPDWSKADELTAKITTSGELVVENVPTGGGGTDDKGQPVPVRTAVFALRNVAGEIHAPLSGIPAEARAGKRASAKLGAAAFDRSSADASLGRLDVQAAANMDGSAPDATVSLAGVNTVALGSLIGQRELVEGSLGETANATLRIKPGSAGPAAGAAGQVLAIDAELTSPRVTGAKLSFAKDDSHLWLTQPSTITWNPNVQLINKLLASSSTAAPAQPGSGGKRPAAPSPAKPSAQLLIEQAQPITVNMSKLALAMGGSTAPNATATGPLKPGIFEMDVGVRAPSLGVSIANADAAKPPTKLTFDNVTVGVTSAMAAAGADKPNPIAIDLGIDHVSGEGISDNKRSTAKLRIANPADASGVVNAANFRFNGDVDISSFPSPIVDELANQGGLLAELLGPTVSLQSTARNLSINGEDATGKLTVDATSPRATAKLQGRLKNGEFIQNGPVSIELREIRTQLVQELAGGLPLVQSLEKTPQDKPATITTEGLTVPIDNDLTKLNGKVTIDLGVARFTTSNLIGKLVKGIGGREAGAIGRKIEPFVINLNHGVAKYDRFSLPVGEFALDTRGEVDLVKKTINVVTYVPIFALTDEAAGLLNTGIAGKIGILDRNTMVPITTKGSLDKPQTGVDVGLFMKETGENIFKTPGNLLDKIINPGGKKDDGGKK